MNKKTKKPGAAVLDMLLKMECEGRDYYLSSYTSPESSCSELKSAGVNPNLVHSFDEAWRQWLSASKRIDKSIANLLCAYDIDLEDIES